jgi:hypothetical protein
LQAVVRSKIEGDSLHHRQREFEEAESVQHDEPDRSR